MDTDRETRKARSLLLRLLTYRARGKKEVVGHLERRGFTAEVIDTVVGEMEEQGYINDRRFVDDYIDYRKQQGYGPVRVSHELKMKGLNSSLVEEKVSERFDPEEDRARIREIVEKRLSRGGQAEARSEKWFRRELDFLLRRGFRKNQVVTVLGEFGAGDDPLF